MLQHSCIDHLQEHTIDHVYPFGDIESELVYECSVCGKQYNVTECNKLVDNIK